MVRMAANFLLFASFMSLAVFYYSPHGINGCEIFFVRSIHFIGGFFLRSWRE
jgi:hypothetical protein